MGWDGEWLHDASPNKENLPENLFVSGRYFSPVIQMTFHARRARTEDAGAACRAVRRSIEVCCLEDHQGEPARLDLWLRNKTPENFLAWIESDSLYCTVVERSSSVVGFGMASVSGELLLCFVAPEVRFQGVGKALLQAIERWATTASISTLRLESTQTALPFYRRNGFMSCGPVATFAGMESQPMCKQLLKDPNVG